MIVVSVGIDSVEIIFCQLCTERCEAQNDSAEVHTIKCLIKKCYEKNTSIWAKFVQIKDMFLLDWLDDIMFTTK